jgi:hypothetical protein
MNDEPVIVCVDNDSEMYKRRPDWRLDAEILFSSKGRSILESDLRLQ